MRGQRDRIALLRALARQAAGVERLDVQHRLCRELLATGQVADLTEAQATLEEMIASAGFAGWARADAALYDLAASRQAARREADALAVWRRLLTEHPTSTYAPDAALALAEAAFVAGELPQAEAGYLRVLGFPGHHTRAYARYKLGWVHLNLGRSSEALADFVEVARTSKDPLRREAIKDVVRVYAELGVAAKALPFLERVDPGHGGALVLRLADSYADIGKLGDAAIAYRAALDVLDPDAGCEAALGLVKVLAAGAQRDEALAAVEALAARRPTGTCGIAAEAVVTELANGWRTEALASRAPELEAIAIRCWELVAQLAQGAPSHRAALAAAAQLRARRP